MPGPVTLTGGNFGPPGPNPSILAELIGNVPPVRILAGSGDPNETLSDIVFQAPVGSIFLRWDGSVSRTLYVREGPAGQGGWIAK